MSNCKCYRKKYRRKYHYDSICVATGEVKKCNGRYYFKMKSKCYYYKHYGHHRKYVRARRLTPSIPITQVAPEPLVPQQTITPQDNFTNDFTRF